MLAKQWDCRQVNRLFAPQSAWQIMELELPVVSYPADCRIWPLTESNDYSIETGYVIVLQHQQNGICSSAWQMFRSDFVVSYGVCTACQSGSFFHRSYGKMALPSMPILNSWSSCFCGLHYFPGGMRGQSTLIPVVPTSPECLGPTTLWDRFSNNLKPRFQRWALTQYSWIR